MANNTLKVFFLYLINFLASFLLFQIELIIAKILLPKFGGSYNVWGACIVFFQCALLLGYLYAHMTFRAIGIQRYRYFHFILLFVPFLFFPGRPLTFMETGGHLPLVIEVFRQLAMSIGLVFFILSTISMVSQTWVAASQLPQRKNPYMLYAVSNIGSFCALLSYPFIFEQNLDIPHQLGLWRAGYLILVLSYLAAFFLIPTEDKDKKEAPRSLPLWTRPIRVDGAFWGKVRWFLFSAAGTIIFLSVTNVITSEIVPCPLLWIIPLAIYLFSFVLIFRDRPFYPRWMQDKSSLILGFSAMLFFLTKMRALPVTAELAAYFLSLFCLCMVCQHGLYEGRPRDKQDMTLFYVILSLGGFAGGMFVAWIAPRVFNFPMEYLVGLWLAALGAGLGSNQERSWRYLRFIFYLLAAVMFWPVLFHGSGWIGWIALAGLFYAIFSGLQSSPRAVAWALLSLLLISPFIYKGWAAGTEIAAFRNYYGIYTLRVERGILFFFNGTTIHGCQYLDSRNEKIATTYFHRHTPVGKVLSDPGLSFKRIGVVGLGAGTLAAYGQKGQVMDFYELDPDIVNFANRFFSFIKNSSAQVNCLVGDGRINLAKSGAVYDLLIIDAFSGDSIPVHLLTTEAIAEYRRHLAPDGIILFHISNLYLNLHRVILSNAKALGGHALIAWNEEKEDKIYRPTVWGAITWDEGKRKTLIDRLGWGEMDFKKGAKRLPPWTDSYSCVLSILKEDAFH